MTKSIALFWGGLVTIILFGKSYEGGTLQTVALLMFGWIPMAFLVLRERKMSANSNQGKRLLLSQSGLTADSKFVYWGGDSGVALNINAQTISLAGNEVVKTYKFSDVRSWRVNHETPGQVAAVGGVASVIALTAGNLGAINQAKANSGLYIKVSDIEYPEYRIQMPKKVTQNRWFEILTQVLNEGGIKQ